MRRSRLATLLLAPMMTLPFLALGASSAQAAEVSVTFNATADTYVSSGSPNRANGSSQTLRIDDPASNQVAYVKFNVQGIPADATNITATLRIKGTGATQPAGTLRFHEALTPWSESTTFNTRPTATDVFATASIDNGVTINLPVPVDGNGEASFVMSRNTTGSETILGSREHSTADLRPRLTVTYTEAEAPPPPPPPPAGGFDTVGITQAQLDAIPASGAAWTELVAMADAAYTVDTTDGAPDGVGNAVAGAFVYARTGNTAYKTKVNNALDAAQAVSPASWDQAAANRHLGGWATAGQLIGRPVRNADGSLNAWGNWLNQHLTVTHTGGVTRNKVMLNTARGWDNNHGAAARQSVAAIEAYLDLPLTTSCNAMKAWLGGTHADYAFVADTSPGPNQMGWSDKPGSQSWYVSGHLAGLGPVGHGLRSGAIPSDVERDDAFYPNIGAAGADHYVYGNLYREVAAMTTLAANGCSLWTYADSAAKRGFLWAQANIPDHEDDYLGNADAALNEVYGLSYPEDVGTGENLLVASEWLTTGTGWPVQ